MIFGRTKKVAHVLNKYRTDGKSGKNYRYPTIPWLGNVQKYAPKLSLAEAVQVVLEFLDTHASNEVVSNVVSALQATLNSGGETVAAKTHDLVKNMADSMEVSAFFEFCPLLPAIIHS
jgi:hypothetical protein